MWGAFALHGTCCWPIHKVLWTFFPLVYVPSRSSLKRLFARRGPIGALGKLCPLLQGAGVGTVIISFLLCTYYNVILAWSLFYLAASFQVGRALAQDKRFLTSRCSRPCPGPPATTGGTRRAATHRYSPIHVIGWSTKNIGGSTKKVGEPTKDIRESVEKFVMTASRGN